MLIRGTTPSIGFHIKTELDLNNVAEIWITFKTRPGIPKVHEKTYTIEDVDIDAENKVINLFMPQEDTLEFEDVPYEIQIRLRMNDDMAFASKIIDEPIGRILKDGMI